MNPIELLVSLLAPHTCLGCGKEGRPLCQKCACFQFPELPSSAVLKHLSATAYYEGSAKQLLKALKFDRAKAAGKLIAALMPEPPGRMLTVCPVPTANKRVRSRGYDQAALIAKAYTRKHKLKYAAYLRRMGSTRQVGAGREARFRQLAGSYAVRKKGYLKGGHILLIDDVFTTGATLESAAKILLNNGAVSVSAAVFAFSKPKCSSSTGSDAGQVL